MSPLPSPPVSPFSAQYLDAVVAGLHLAGSTSVVAGSALGCSICTGGPRFALQSSIRAERTSVRASELNPCQMISMRWWPDPIVAESGPAVCKGERVKEG
jgi:hypothetical protein